MPTNSGPGGKQKGRGDSPFAQVPKASIQRSVFNRSHSLKTTFDAGLLIPIYMDEALPGDTFTLRMNSFARLATPLKPIMDNLHMETFFFAVPNRLLWQNWKRFMGEQDTPADSTDFVVPQVNFDLGNPVNGSISDYFGIPTPIASGAAGNCSAFWHRAYNFIYNEWFRDQNLSQPQPRATSNGPDTESQYKLMRRGKRHDYFTSCLPWPMKALNATSSVGIPVTSTAETILFSTGASNTGMKSAGGLPNVSDLQATSTVNAGVAWSYDATDTERTGLEVLTNQLRQSMQIQKLLERDARGGTRYTEMIKAHFGVTSPDARQQRPEYLGGGYAPVTINPIAQTGFSATDVQVATTPQGNLAGIGTASMVTGFHKSFTEHCTLLGLVCVRADQTYQFGLERMFRRTTRFDYFWPVLAQIGEQAVLQEEINTGNADVTAVFGYQERYAEYRYKESKITGLFRSVIFPSLTGSLDLWHLAQDYTGDIILNDLFIEENPPIDRIIAVPSEPHC